MLKKFTILVSIFLAFNSQAQKEAIGHAIDSLTLGWDQESKYLEEYTGFKRFCDDATYRSEVIHMLKDIHHYDSVLYKRLVDAQRFQHDKEISRTLKDIARFEEEYDMKSFLVFLEQECVSLHKIERTKNNLNDEFGSESYDGKIYILLNETGKYLKHITKRVDLLRKHVHHLHIN